MKYLWSLFSQIFNNYIKTKEFLKEFQLNNEGRFFFYFWLIFGVLLIGLSLVNIEVIIFQILFALVDLVDVVFNTYILAYIFNNFEFKIFFNSAIDMLASTIGEINSDSILIPSDSINSDSILIPSDSINSDSILIPSDSINSDSILIPSDSINSDNNDIKDKKQYIDRFFSRSLFNFMAIYGIMLTPLEAYCVKFSLYAENFHYVWNNLNFFYYQEKYWVSLAKHTFDLRTTFTIYYSSKYFENFSWYSIVGVSNEELFTSFYFFRWTMSTIRFPNFDWSYIFECTDPVIYYYLGESFKYFINFNNVNFICLGGISDLLRWGDFGYVDYKANYFGELFKYNLYNICNILKFNSLFSFSKLEEGSLYYLNNFYYYHIIEVDNDIWPILTTKAVTSEFLYMYFDEWYFVYYFRKLALGTDVQFFTQMVNVVLGESANGIEQFSYSFRDLMFSLF